MIGKPSLTLLLAAGTALSIVAHGAAAVAPEPAPATRMGTAIRQDMTERDRAAAQRQRALDLREQAARATEERLKASVATSRTADPAAPHATAASAAGAGEPGGNQYESLARIYQAMKPAKAARVFEQLSLDVQIKVALHLRERSAAQIFASMSPDRAARLTMALAQRGPVSPALPERTGL